MSLCVMDVGIIHWDWCPEHKNTPRHFECHRGIKSDKVIDMIKSLG